MSIKPTAPPPITLSAMPRAGKTTGMVDTTEEERIRLLERLRSADRALEAFRASPGRQLDAAEKIALERDRRMALLDAAASVSAAREVEGQLAAQERDRGQTIAWLSAIVSLVQQQKANLVGVDFQRYRNHDATWPWKVEVKVAMSELPAIMDGEDEREAFAERMMEFWQREVEAIRLERERRRLAIAETPSLLELDGSTAGDGSSER